MNNDMDMNKDMDMVRIFSTTEDGEQHFAADYVLAIAEKCVKILNITNKCGENIFIQNMEI